jgi:branched-chain amino acid transport system permease protein
MLAQQFVNALSLGCVYALFALGFTLVFGVLGIINLAHGALFAVGAYVALSFITGLGTPLCIALILSFVVAGVCGALIDRLVLKPLRQRNAPHLAPMIATISVGIVLNNGIQGFYGPNNLRFPPGVLPEGTLIIRGIHLTAIELTIVFLSFFLMAVLIMIVHRTQFGRTLRAIAESPKTAWLLGINVEQMFLITSFLAAGLSGVAGLLIGLYSNALYPLMGEPVLHKGIAAVILGGMGDIRGAMLGGLFLGFAEVLSVAYVGSTMRDAVAFGLLFLILLMHPQGVFGKVVQRKA